MANLKSKKPKTRQNNTKDVTRTTEPAAVSEDETKPAEAAGPAEPDKPDMSKEHIRTAIQQGQAILKEGKSKADAARAIYALLKDEDRDTVIEAFIQGATITQKGAPTYYYNVSRKFKKDQMRAEKEKAQL